MTDMPPYLAANDEESKSGEIDSDSSDFEDDLPLSYDKPRHLEPIRGPEREEHTWRVKEKYKTHCVALVLCLNVGVDPPDVVKTQPCARLECWIDPQSLSPTKALESIGQALQSQYERWQPRARYKQSLDPTSDEIKKLCCSLRRNAKEERVLFHYNGHGVPKPTSQGEIWVFNRAYTQYIPLSMYDLQSWMGAPSLYVYDCSNAGVIVDNFKQFAEQHERDYEMAMSGKRSPLAGGGGGGGGAGGEAGGVSYRNCIQLGACAAGQALPMSPELPADLFTACLTTPVKMAIKWFVLRTRLRVATHDLLDLIDKIPGQVTDRRTMLGELNWIFTAITDTIAWSSLPPELFQQLFRADLLTASLCRNFLLADRIMRSYNCTPVSSPALPSLAQHPLWAAWEHTLDLALAQLPALLAPPGAPAPTAALAPQRLYTHSHFFSDQLTAFQLWLDLGSVSRPPPDQLPMVLQVLLSTLHRVRALQILCRFLALGGAAVRAVLHVGIFPYMLKLLQASAPDLRPTMVYIWAKIVAVDPSCQVDLVNAKGHKYFLSILQDPTINSQHRTLAAFVLAGIVDNYPAGQEAALQGAMIPACLEQVGEGAGCACGALALWACVALGRLWRGSEAARWAGARDLAHEKLLARAAHPRPEVRAAVAFALAAFVAEPAPAHAPARLLVAAALAQRLPADASALLRAEALAALQWMVLIFEQYFIAVYIQERMRRRDNKDGSRVRGGPVDPGTDVLAGGRAPAPRAQPPALPAIGFGSVYTKLWSTLCAMAREPHPQLSRMANDIINHIANQVDSVGHEAERAERVERSGSSSLPPSPNTRPAPPPRTSTLPHPGHRRGKSGLPHTISEDSVAMRDRDRDSSSSTSSQTSKKPIVETQFVEWASSHFARGEGAESAAGPPGPCCCGPAPAPAPADCESASYHERVWRRARNASIRREARALRAGRGCRLETQQFQSRCALPPAVVLFHPYDQHIAVASKDNFGIWDWGTGAKLCVGGWKRAWGRITSLAYLNTHARAILAVGSHQGNVALYRASGEPSLVAAWRALDVSPAPDLRPPPAQPLYSLAQLMSEQWGAGDEKLSTNKYKQMENDVGAECVAGLGSGPWRTLVRWAGARGSLAVAGAAATARLWDCGAELLQAELATGTEAAATALWRPERAPAPLLLGHADGSVRAWDERALAAPLYSLPPHAAPVLAAVPRADTHTLVVGSVEGTVTVYDSRKLAPLETVRAPAPLAAVDVHPVADLLACGSVNQCISIYDLKGNLLNTIKFHEGLLGARIGPVSCLAFHPLRCALGVGSKDSSVSVYVAEARR